VFVVCCLHAGEPHRKTGSPLRFHIPSQHTESEALELPNATGWMLEVRSRCWDGTCCAHKVVEELTRTLATPDRGPTQFKIPGALTPRPAPPSPRPHSFSPPSSPSPLPSPSRTSKLASPSPLLVLFSSVQGDPDLIQVDRAAKHSSVASLPLSQPSLSPPFSFVHCVFSLLRIFWSGYVISIMTSIRDLLQALLRVTICIRMLNAAGPRRRRGWPSLRILRTSYPLEILTMSASTGRGLRRRILVLEPRSVRRRDWNELVYLHQCARMRKCVSL
jgi:hypothetical protein